MKKRTISILAIFMVTAFFGLLAIQFHYLQRTIHLQEDRFHSTVKRSLVHVVRLLEEAEADQYLNEVLQAEAEERRQLFTQKIDNPPFPALSSKHNIYASESQLSLSVKQSGKNSIEVSSELLRERLREHISHRKAILDEITFRWIRDAASTPILERIDKNMIGVFLTKELSDNGLNIPFRFAVSDKEGNWVYIENPEEEPKDKITVFTQQLFPSESSFSPYYLSIWFPNSAQYITRSLLLLYPALLLTGILILTSIFFIFIIFREKRLAEIKTDFVNNMTHELKTPISTIFLAGQMLTDDVIGKTPRMLNHVSNIIKDESRRLGFQVEKVLQMAMLEKEKTLLRFKEMDVNEIIKGCVVNFSIKVESKNGKIIPHLDAEESRAMIDEVHFTNVIYNLMDNAVKYSKGGKVILTIDTWNEKDYLCISVQDDGIGIKRDDLKHIFEKFYRVPTGNVHNVKGFGLGLAYVKKIIDQHKGKISAESEFKLGTKFIIKIPIFKD